MQTDKAVQLQQKYSRTVSPDIEAKIHRLMPITKLKYFVKKKCMKKFTTSVKGPVPKYVKDFCIF